MKAPLRVRFSIYALLAAGYLAGILATAAFVGLPALERVDRSLAPLQSVFQAIADRQRQIIEEIDLLDQLLKVHSAPIAHVTAESRGAPAPSSLLSLYGSMLAPAVSKKLAVAEDELGAIESAYGEAVARYQLGDRVGAREKLDEVRRAEDRTQQHYTETMVLALNTGLEARQAFRKSMVTLAWSAAAWLLVGVILVVVIGYDANRHVALPIQILEKRVQETALGDWSKPVRFEPGDELSELAEQFNTLTDALQQRAGHHAHLATAGELLAGAAHELNNPLQAIRSTAELKLASEPGTRDWSTVLAQVERASKLTRDLVQFVRPAPKEIRLISLNDVVKTAVDLVGFQYRADGIGLELDLEQAGPRVMADSHELVQVFVNLLGNAHGVLARADGPKRVFVRTWTEAGVARGRVRDTGPGIPPETRARIFSPFFSTRATGVGLGLTVSRHLMRGLGGDLVLDEPPADGGTSFTLSLHAVNSPAPPHKPAVANGPRAGRPGERSTPFDGITILVVDDEDAIRGVLERYFRRDGATVVAAAGGKRAVELIRDQPIDVVVLDLRMPDMDGAEVYRIVRQERPELASRVVFLSGDATRLTEEMEIAPNRVLVKPVELVDLRRAVSDLVKELGR